MLFQDYYAYASQQRLKIYYTRYQEEYQQLVNSNPILALVNNFQIPAWQS